MLPIASVNGLIRSQLLPENQGTSPQQSHCEGPLGPHFIALATVEVCLEFQALYYGGLDNLQRYGPKFLM